MTNAPESRKTHIIRILGTNKDEEILTDIWADVERIDIMKEDRPGADRNFQGIQRKFRWMDNPDDSQEYDPDGNPSRKTEILKVCDPSSDNLDDPEEWIPIPVIKRMKVVASDDNFQGVQERMLNDLIESSRVVESRRIFHYDTNIDEDAQAAFEADPDRKVYVVKGEDYFKKDGSNADVSGEESTKDEDQYVEHEVIKLIKQRGNYKYTTLDSEFDQGRQTKLKNDYLIDESEKAKKEEVGEKGFNPPYRLDPFQNIVNVQFKPREEVMLVWNSFDIFDPNAGTKRSRNTKDGYDYIDGFGNNVWAAASGFGMTVVVPQAQTIVFGKPRDGDACFMRIMGNSSTFKDIRRGVLDNNGELQWSTVKSVSDDGGTTALSFAGGAFFVSSNDVDSKSFLYTSFDGEEWNKSTVAENPNGGEDGQNGQPAGYNVAFKLMPTPDNPKAGIYCHTGSFIRAYQYDIVDVDDGRTITAHTSTTNFWSAVSTDGFSWSPKYNKSKFVSGDSGTAPVPTGTLKSTGFCHLSIACGAGVFVATSSWPIEYDYYQFGGGGGVLNEFQHDYAPIDTCAIATSTDGMKWTNVQLPDVHWDPGVYVFDPHGIDTVNRSAISGLDQGIIWCKTGGTDPETKKPKGFFLLSGIERAIANHTGEDFTVPIYHKKRWVSPDGFSWTLAYSSKTDGPDRALSVHNKNHGEEVFI